MSPRSKSTKVGWSTETPPLFAYLQDLRRDATSGLDLPEVVDSHAMTVLFILIGCFENRETGRCNPTVETLARACRRSVATVERATKVLVDLGFLTVVPGARESSTKQAPNNYLIHYHLGSWLMPGSQERAEWEQNTRAAREAWYAAHAASLRPVKAPWNKGLAGKGLPRGATRGQALAVVAGISGESVALPLTVMPTSPSQGGTAAPQPDGHEPLTVMHKQPIFCSVASLPPEVNRLDASLEPPTQSQSERENQTQNETVSPAESHRQGQGDGETQDTDSLRRQRQRHLGETLREDQDHPLDQDKGALVSMPTSMPKTMDDTGPRGAWFWSMFSPEDQDIVRAVDIETLAHRVIYRDRSPGHPDGSLMPAHLPLVPSHLEAARRRNLSLVRLVKDFLDKSGNTIRRKNWGGFLRAMIESDDGRSRAIDERNGKVYTKDEDHAARVDQISRMTDGELESYWNRRMAEEDRDRDLEHLEKYGKDCACPRCRPPEPHDWNCECGDCPLPF